MRKHYYANCIICTNKIYAERIDDINMIFEDDLKTPVGHPICEECFDLLKERIPRHLNYLKRYFKKKWNQPSKKIGLEAFL